MGTNFVNMIGKGFKRMANGLRKVLHNDFDSRQDFDFFGLGGGGNLFSSSAWIIPTTVLSSGLLFREEINTFVNDFFSKYSVNITQRKAEIMLRVIFS